MDPAGLRSYRGGPSEANAARTVFRETPNFRAIALIGNPSARCNRRISAQSSTDNTPALPRLGRAETRIAGGQDSADTPGSVFPTFLIVQAGSYGPGTPGTPGMA